MIGALTNMRRTVPHLQDAASHLGDAYECGVDVLGAGIGDFVPWLGIVGKVAGGLTGAGGDSAGGKTGAAASTTPSTQETVRQMLEQERTRRALEQAQASAQKSQMIAFGAIGVLGLGLVALAFRK